MEKVKLSIIIPFFNEEERLEPNLSRSISYLKSHIKEPFELIFVNDGSTDKTSSILSEAKERQQNLPVKILTYPRNKGKGYAVRTGVLNSNGEKIIVMDGDFSIDLSETTKFIEKLNRYDLVIASKKHLLTQTLRQQKAPRRILGKSFTLLTNFLLGLNFTDVTCGFKGFKGSVGKKLFAKQKINRWAYDAETLFLAKHFKYKVLEIPVKWQHVEGSRVSPLIDTVRSLRELITVIFNYYSGKYDQKA